MSIAGAIDGFSINPLCLNGWAKKHGKHPLLIEARDNGAVVAVSETNVERTDIGGVHGFRLKLAGNDMENIKALLLGRIQIYAVGADKEKALPYFQQMENRFWAVAASMIASRLDEAGKRDFLAKIDGGKKPPAISAEEKLIDGAKPAPLSYFGVKPGLLSPNLVSVVGRDGHMFILKGNNDLISMYRQERQSPEVEAHAEAWVNLFKKRREAFQRLGVGYRQLIIPEKSSIAPEFFPVDIPKRTPMLDAIEERVNLGSELAESYISVHKLVTEDPKRLDIIRRIDSHWTPFGSWQLFKGILRTLRIEEKSEFEFPRVAFFPGDLGGAYPQSYFREPLYFPPLEPFANLEKNLRQIEFQEPASGGHVGFRAVWKNDGAPLPFRVIAFGNSFFERGHGAATLSWWAARWFREFHFLWYPEIDYDYVEKVRPDTVICQTIERFLPRLPET